ncbi:DEAD/DEAH box helicase [Corynebacterium jeikeium]|uniref:DEAD/DEAH box helicase n=2 Tax=Corynebacterium jeikeium TaxID=38289 RepID=UPI000556B8E0|nr:DEAD/DEAH box helicase [Corynebacterium jeikeium]OOD32392.1 DEAD/DEAH box helicase [Corynebacterium jeikeium]WCZ53002.1 putative ATP-dependent helicase Lhr [Corynebacterium jeikeium]SUY81691.1 ATP-dependent DNA helicase [Corynebacterium jeikeium]
MAVDPLDSFYAPVAAWFRDVFAEPTIVQTQAWRAISAGQNALVVAPTGSGKTLAAFLWSLSRLSGGSFFNDAPTPEKSSPTKVLYISPLKALGVDVSRNLAAPLAGIARVADAMGETAAPVRVGVRSGDTPQSERSKLLRNPPEILVTTPESLYLMLTSKAAATLANVDTVIVDEVHAVAGTKRGTHLALSLERLEMLTGRAVQRIGLSATVNPVDKVASFLGGDRPVTVVNPEQPKSWDVQVTSVVEDFQDPPAVEDVALAEYEVAESEAASEKETEEALVDGAPVDEALLGPSLIGEGVGGSTQVGSGARVASGVDKESALPQQKSVWPHVQRAIYRQVMENRSTLVFVNSRRAAERLTGALNEEWAKEHDPDALAAPTRRDPAQMMAQSGAVRGMDGAGVARAHHGSVSKDERADIEAALKSGELRCVVATSSLELGIDMGLVDHVVQVGAPPSVAAAVQRCGRAGHNVGATSHATIYPLHKQDAEAAVVVVDRLLKGELEPLHVVHNALDVLAQQTVAATVQAGAGGTSGADGTGALDVEEWWRVVRRAHPYATLPREAFDGVIEMISGRYPSTDFADLKARAIYDPVAGTLEARPGAQRLAVTSGGTIPDRGMFGVFLAAGENDGARRVGELDEEMVYESRVGDVFTLGASSWRILEINRDQVIVAPAAGHTGRLPFWVGDAAGRPVELGKAIGENRRTWGSGTLADIRSADFLDAHTRANLDAYYQEQKETAGIIPDERTVLIERFRDDIGDWRVVVHTPFGRGVNAPWALALGAELNRRTGIDAMAVAGDDGMVLRLPYSDEPPGMELLLGEGYSGAERAEATLADVMEEVGSSALFAARFRESAARALLLPRRNPGKRQPLWQQRQRAAQLLDVAREHPEFPVMVETMRECVHDVYNLDFLKALVANLGQRGVRLAEVTTEAPSAFAESLLFTYTSAFMYEGDSAERAAALAVDPALLAKVLGTREEGMVLDPTAVRRVVDAAQWLAEGRQAASVEQAVDMLRALGPLSLDGVRERIEPWAGTVEDSLEQLRELVPTRLIEVHFGGQLKLGAVEDMPLLRDGLGVPVPPGVAIAAEQVDQVDNAIDQLLLRWMKNRGPTTAAEAAAEFGLGRATSDALLARWAGGVQGTGKQRRLSAGHFVDLQAETQHTETQHTETQYVDTGMLRRLRSATLAAARGSLEPVTQQTYAQFLADWHGLGQMQREELASALEQLAGVPIPASAWETLVLPARIPDYQPGDLDELLSTGEILAVGSGQAGAKDAWLCFIPAGMAEYLLEGGEGLERGVHKETVTTLGMVATQILEHLQRGGAFLAAELQSVTGADPEEVDAALWELFDAGLVAPDSFAAVRARLAEAGPTGKQAHRAPRRNQGRGSARRVRMGRSGFARAARRSMNAHSSVPGRWSAVYGAGTGTGIGAGIDAVGELEAPLDAAELALVRSEAWIDRYAVVTRGAVVTEKAAGGFAEAYRTLSAWEDSGEVLRGYIVEGLGGAQFAPRDVISQLRRAQDGRSRDAGEPATPGNAPQLLSVLDPANPFGSTLPWPEVSRSTAEGISPTRTAGAMIIIAAGRAEAYVSRGGKNVSLFSRPDFGDATSAELGASAPQIDLVVGALKEAIRAQRLSPVTIEKVNGSSVMDIATTDWVAAGARLTPKGLSIRA